MPEIRTARAHYDLQGTGWAMSMEAIGIQRGLKGCLHCKQHSANSTWDSQTPKRMPRVQTHTSRTGLGIMGGQGVETKRRPNKRGTVTKNLGIKRGMETQQERETMPCIEDDFGFHFISIWWAAKPKRKVRLNNLFKNIADKKLFQL